MLDIVRLELRHVSDQTIDSHVKNLRRKNLAVVPGCERIASVSV